MTKDFLLSISCGGDDFNTVSPASTMAFVPKGLLMEMNNFRGKKGISSKALLAWLQVLCPKFQYITTVKFNRLLAKISSGLKAKQKRKGDPGGAQQLEEFKDAPCLPDVLSSQTLSCSTTETDTTSSAAVSFATTASDVTSSVATAVSSTVSMITDSSSHASCSVPSTDNCVLEKLPSDVLSEQVSAVLSDQIHINSIQSELQALKEIMTEKNDTISSIQVKAVKLKELNNTLQTKLQTSRKCELASKAKLRETKRLCVELKHSNLYRRHVRLQTKYQEAVNHSRIVHNLSAELKDEKNKKRRYQKYASKVETKRKRIMHDLQSANDTILTLLNERNNAQTVIPETRTESGFFKDFVVKCVYELIGECRVPATRCREIIQTVSKHFFGVIFFSESLPGKTTSLRFADQSHSLSRIQVAEALSQKRYDMHTDGTSKKTKKFVGFQVTLENQQTLCLGFDPVANETAQTVLDIALSKLDEFAMLTSTEDTEAEKKKMLQNLVGLMTDRANTMKCVGKLLKQHITATLQQEVQIEFLHCNAHFLLGISTGAEKALVRVAKENGLEGRLGRDNIPAFHGFTARSSESAVCRHVQLKCIILIHN